MSYGMIRASFGIVDLEDDKVPGREHDVEIVRVDPEQDRGHSTMGLLFLRLPLHDNLCGYLAVFLCLQLNDNLRGHLAISFAFDFTSIYAANQQFSSAFHVTTIYAAT